MSPTTQLQKPLGVVFGLLSVLKVRAMRIGLWLIDQSGYRATGRRWRRAIGLYVRIDFPTAGGVHSGAARIVKLQTSEAVIGITWARV